MKKITCLLSFIAVMLIGLSASADAPYLENFYIAIETDEGGWESTQDFGSPSSCGSYCYLYITDDLYYVDGIEEIEVTQKIEQPYTLDYYNAYYWDSDYGSFYTSCDSEGIYATNKNYKFYECNEDGGFDHDSIYWNDGDYISKIRYRYYSWQPTYERRYSASVAPI